MRNDKLFPFKFDRVPELRPNTMDERNDPDFIHRPDKYDEDYIWDGETMDEEKP